MEKRETNLEEFVNNYSFGHDHVHLSAIICNGQVGVDPIFLYKNKEKFKRASKKFPGTGFDLEFLESGFLTKSVERELENFRFEEYQYKKMLNFYKEKDLTTLSVDDIFLKSEYLFFFKKALILGVLEKTGLLIDFDETPFYLDVGPNESDKRYKVYRLFYIAKSFQTVPVPKNNKVFYDKHSRNVSSLEAQDYLKIFNFIRNDLKIRYDMYAKLLYTYYPPLVRLLEGL